jgi:hypothetical protein
MPIRKCSTGVLLLLCLSFCGCGNLLRVRKFDPNNPQGVPFFVKHGVCVQQTVYANPYWRLTLTYSPSKGQTTLQTILVSEAVYNGPDFSALAATLAQQPAPDSHSVLTAWDDLKNASKFDPWADLKGQRLLANSSSLTTEVDYQTAYAINQKKPFSGSSQADFKLAADGTLNEASGQVQDNTLATIASALPISSLITSAAGIVTPVGKAANEEKVPATFVLKQEQRYIKIVDSQNTLASQGFCPVGKPLKQGDDNVAIAMTDVGSTDTSDTVPQDKNTDSISISGTIKLPKSLQPATPAQSATDGSKMANDGASSSKGPPTSATGQKKK